MPPTELMEAVKKGDFKAVRANLSEVGKKDEYGETALMFAVINGHAYCIPLLEKEIGMQNKRAWTALMWAAYYGKTDCARLLLSEAGKQTTEEWNNFPPGTTALILAVHQNHFEVVKLLLPYEQGMKDSEGHTAQWYAHNSSKEDDSIHVRELLKNEGTERIPPPLDLFGALKFLERVDKITNENTSLKQQLDNAINESKRHAKMNEDLRKASDQKQALINSLTTEKATLQEQLSKTTEDLKRALADQKAQILVLEKENANRQARIEELVAEKTSLQEQLASSKKAQDGAEGELAQMNQEIDLLRQQLQKASEEAKKAQEVDQLNAEIIGLRGDVKDREEEIRDLQAQLEKSLNLQEQLEESQNTSKKKQRELDDYIAALRLENEELRREYNRMETKNVREAEASRKENQQLEVLNNELARLRKEGEDRENHYRSAIEELKRKHSTEVTALRQRMEERDNMADERSQREKEFRNTALALERAMAEVASLRKENEELHRTSSVVTSGPREQPLENKNREVPTSTSVSGQPRTRGDQVAQCQASTGREELVEMVKTGMDREREGEQARTAISHQSRLSPIDLLSRDAQTRADNYRQRELTSQRPAAEYQQRYGVATSGSTVAQLMAELGYDKREEYSPNTTAGVARNLSEQTRRGEGVHQWTSSHLTEHKETSIGSRVSGRSPDLPSRTYQYGPSRDVQAQPQKVMVNSRQSVQPSPRVTTSSRTNTSRSPKTPESDKKEDVRRGYDTSRGRLDSSTGRSVTRDASALVGRGTLASSPYSPKMSGNASTGATARAFKTVSPVTYSSSSGVSTGARAESHISPSSRRSSLTGTRTNTTTGSSY
ncbi:Ankyrin repeat protein 3 [Giardia muris]|uniref:Ankyrin repeat protein 3 n=1 Tax=Giardia muris TaxID=5742 RepID=A0A4Z1STL4_GIAMU|nr:Ankyrin repeat protein 3 [Giardia muris]|eukprot:TNJ29272.1 Ankyrin repeat protein 3 [Giardia muris]